MLRSLLVLLAALVPGLAVLFNRPWLNVLTIVIVVGGLGLLGWWLWTQFQSDAPERPRPRPEPEDTDPSLDEFGIVDIQPEGAGGPPSADSSDEHVASASEHPSSGTSGPESTDQNPATAAPPSTSSGEPGAPATSSSAPETSENSHEEAPVLGPLLESVRAALDAQTVCLLVQEEVALTYRIEALASTHTAVQQSGTFDTQTPLLTATMSREAVTIRTLTDDEVAVEDLGYYTSPPAVDHLAVAPVSRPDESSSTFLLADAPEEVDLSTSRARTVLDHFADTVAFLLAHRSDPSSPAADMNKRKNGQSAPPSSSGAADEQQEESPRPRRDIIADEMEAAQTNEEELALALIHLNRAESIARRGDEAVRSAEHLFQARLEQLLPNQRIERFGELTYGIFFRDGADAVEPQVADLEATLAQEEGELEGGVSVGVAVWNGRDTDPENLRTEATEALREAYETGTPTIVT